MARDGRRTKSRGELIPDIFAPTWGFESEWEEGAREMLPILHEEELIGMTELHSYHCDCEHCSRYSPYPLKAQNDSSCSGEIISNVRAGWGMEDKHLVTVLQDAAIEADATPGYSAGFHVHVGADMLSEGQKALLVWEWLKWERPMSLLASGCFQSMRGFNEPLCGRLDYLFHRNYWIETAPFYGDSFFVSVERDQPPHALVRKRLRWMEENTTRRNLKEFRAQVLGWTYDIDRHSSLATRTRYGTFEFRLWNSTRSAWRMELFILASQAWMDPRVVSALSQVDMAENDHQNIGLFAEVLNAHHSRAAELVTRQLAYIASREGMGEPRLAA